jgi:hypothetical protein
MCDLAGKTICASLFGIIGLGLTCGAISSSIVWYSDIESAVGISPQNNAATTLSVSWQATLSNLCIQSGSYYNTGNGAVTITPTCFSYSPSSQAVNPNPNNDATISFLETNYLTEIQAGLNALQKAAGYTTAALGISIALIVIFLLCLGFLGLYKSRYPVSYVLCGFKCVGFLAWLSTLLAFVIYAGGIVKASSDFDVTLPGSTGAVVCCNFERYRCICLGCFVNLRFPLCCIVAGSHFKPRNVTHDWLWNRSRRARSDDDCMLHWSLHFPQRNYPAC